LIKKQIIKPILILHYLSLAIWLVLIATFFLFLLFKFDLLGTPLFFFLLLVPLIISLIQITFLIILLINKEYKYIWIPLFDIFYPLILAAVIIRWGSELCGSACG